MRKDRFQKKIYAYYHKHGRDLPWRKTRNPYHIFISEVMLQQTQVETVLKKYHPFLKAFPSFRALSCASLREVLALWKGLGYNRRALFLKKSAQKVTHEFGARLPSETKVLATLPGIGQATAKATVVFAFNKPEVFLETNIRRVFIHHFFSVQKKVRDSDILPLVRRTLDVSNPRIWYWALMDYGSALKKTHPNPNRKSAHYIKQPPFEGSDRQIRGKILGVLIVHPYLSRSMIFSKIKSNQNRITKCLLRLQKEGFIGRTKNRFHII